jgi:hypothetical protein
VAHACDEPDIMVPVARAPCSTPWPREPRGGESRGVTVAGANPGGLRLHRNHRPRAPAAQDRVHVHCVDTIAFAVTCGAEALLKAGSASSTDIRAICPPPACRWRSHLRAANARYGCRGAGDHGLVVAAETVAEADQLLTAVSTQLRRPARPGRSRISRLRQLAAGSPTSSPSCPESHAAATDRTSCRIAQRQPLS